ncbi:hypothetical protein ACFLZZ_04180 [Nanoarchaeota archaeon]
MITYAELYELLRKEKYTEQLQSLPKGFFNEAAAYFRDKKKVAEKSDDLFNETIAKTKKQLENAISIFKELVTRRQKKVINIAFVASKTGISKRDSENMIDREKKLFDKIFKELGEDEKTIMMIISGLDQGKDLKNQLVRFTQETGEFLGPDERKLGPFKPGDLANLPQKISEILVNSGKAVYVDESN